MTTRELKPIRPQPACPECEKLLAVSEKSNIIGEFLEWFTNKPITYCVWNDDIGEYVPSKHDYMGINDILAEYFGINLDKVEQERRELLEWIREQNG